MKNRRRNEAGSLKNMMPRSTVPTAPMPVHTGYAVPIGRLWTAFASRIMLNDRQIMKPAPHNHHAVPETSFIFPRQNANPDSNIPATISIIQFIIVLHSCLQIYIKYFCRQSRRQPLLLLSAAALVTTVFMLDFTCL